MLKKKLKKALLIVWKKIIKINPSSSKKSKKAKGIKEIFLLATMSDAAKKAMATVKR